MLDRKFVRENLSRVGAMLKHRRMEVDLRAFETLDGERRRLLREVEEMRHRRKQASEEIGRLKREQADASSLLAEVGDLARRIKEIDPRVKEIDARFDELLLSLPNMPGDETPVGASDADNMELRRWGAPREFDYPVRDHVEIGEALGILDMGRAAKISGSRFSLQRGPGALMERALINFMLDTHTRQHGYTEVAPPFLVKAACLRGTGQLPKFSNDLFRVADRDLWLIPTAEVPVTNIFREETLDGEELPIRLCAYTPCFRSEAGAHGKDTRGMIRVHQFNKVELVAFTHPDKSEAEHDSLTAAAERILRALELPYRVVELCTADLGFSARRCFDLEVWVPSQGRYREVSSCSNFGDFQARRAGIRFRTKGEKGSRYVHTLNGSGLAVGRTFVAILENFQEADGSVRVPEALRSYMNGLERIEA